MSLVANVISALLLLMVALIILDVVRGLDKK